MGLDMYLNGNKFIWTNWQNPELNPKEDGFELREKSLRLGYWRKHPNLHGYIVETFADGVDKCQEIGLSAEDMQKIIQAIEAKALPHTEGFFFGRSDGSEDEESIKILRDAIKWVTTKEEGVARSVTYRASW